MPDIFNRTPQQIKTPVTADRCTLTIDGAIVVNASQVQISYSQQVTRRRAIGNQLAIIYGSMPLGQITVSRLIADGSTDILGSAIFSCTGGTVSISGTSCDGAEQIKFTARGAIVSSYTLSVSADDLTVMDSMTIEFLELDKG